MEMSDWLRLKKRLNQRSKAISENKIETTEDNVEVAPTKKKKVIKISGDIDLYSSPDLREALIVLIKSKIPSLYVNLNAVTYIDSSGIATFVEGLKCMKSYGGRLQFFFGRGGSGAGELQHPMGIDISSKGDVFIADTGNHRVAVFDPRGSFLYGFPVKTASEEKPAAPVDVLALDRKNYLYVADKDNHKIKVHKQKGAFVFEWGGFGEVRGRFRYPGILASNQYNQVLVVDVLNTRVQVFDPDGNFLTTIGTWGVSPGQLFRPKGVAVDKADRVFITDSFMGCIQAFTDLGAFLGVVCADGAKQNFTTPVGLVFDAENHMLVVEMRANRIRIVKMER